MSLGGVKNSMSSFDDARNGCVNVCIASEWFFLCRCPLSWLSISLSTCMQFLPDSVNQIFPQFPAILLTGVQLFFWYRRIHSQQHPGNWKIIKFNLSKETQGYTQNFAMEINLGFNNSSRMKDIYLHCSFQFDSELPNLLKHQLVQYSFLSCQKNTLQLPLTSV